jgi:hypothetical protein
MSDSSYTVLYNNFYVLMTIVRHMAPHNVNVIALYLALLSKFCNGDLTIIIAGRNM